MRLHALMTSENAQSFLISRYLSCMFDPGMRVVKDDVLLATLEGNAFPWAGFIFDFPVFA